MSKAIFVKHLTVDAAAPQLLPVGDARFVYAIENLSLSEDAVDLCFEQKAGRDDPDAVTGVWFQLVLTRQRYPDNFSHIYTIVLKSGLVAHILRKDPYW